MKTIKFRNTLTVNLLLMIVISIFGTYAVMIIISKIDTLNNPNGSILQAGLLLSFWFSVVILTFVVIFTLLVRNKILYLGHISETVQHIANGKLGLTIDIKGKDELSQLAGNINYMSKELENKFIHERQLEKVKNELITNISHDLRTPLTSIIGYLNLIKSGQYNNGDQLQEYFETIYLKSQRLNYLLDELFEFTRLSSPDAVLNLNKVDLESLLQQIVGEYIPIFEKEQLHVQTSITEEDIPALIDVEKIVRVYENLFVNAIKYSIKPSNIKISFCLKGNTAVFQVSNKVENPPAEDVNKMFERFFRGDEARMDAQGTGLGLSISKKIIELHNGDIRAGYKDDWISFIVELPIYNEQLQNS
ncbi:two-component sensor histidine kinase [Solibacillus sp. R5-41]|uniref:HAMP domain-containing sensor histidine kinase n=1 Tax=Solibacillus sp. R5-41 TaxID=2048654 RepID=UPI000C124695|nr:HAMP domain-containing sensor histidine kinase [Solibacillus sp. R5-41]ATP42019.1 two-component sensor histidine kinase [Solibacillus sp. R5-41]